MVAEEFPGSDAPVATVRRYVDAFVRADVDAMCACFIAPAGILDGMAPHLWLGAAAARDWRRDVVAEGEHLGACDYRVSLGAPLHAEIKGEAAYVVLPAAMTFQRRGVPVAQAGATFTAALRRSEGEWRIAAWAWAKGRSAAIGVATP